MKIYNEAKTKEITDYNPKTGYLKPDRLLVKHHPAVVAVEEQGHYVVEREYENGGKDMLWIVDVPGVKAQDAYDEYEDIQVYVPYTDEELAASKISELKANLFNTDYQAIKYAEGFISDTDYAAMKAQRQKWRDEINALQIKYNIT